MLKRLNPSKNQTLEQARKVLDAKLGVSGWAAPGRTARTAQDLDKDAPWWWESPEEASDSFLRSMGVVL